ncbi:MAG: ABC transporter ATP-binding protein [Bdellovibrionota bacterium]
MLTDNECVVRAELLVKKFGNFTAVDNVSFDIKKGECVGLLGPNGAGKSTVISMLYGAMSRGGGDLTIFGYDPANKSREIKKRTGIVTQENALDAGMNVFDNMLIFAKFFGVNSKDRKQRVEKLLDFMSLRHKANAMIRNLSGGMQRRLVFVRALINDPDFVILDEPTTGLDPAVRMVIWQKVRQLLEENKTVLLTTHYMDEAEILCDRIVVMNEGKVQATGSPKELIQTYCPGYVAVLKNTSEIKVQLSTNEQSGYELIYEPSTIFVRGPSLSGISQFLEGLGIEPDMIRPANLEDAFLKITGRELSIDA